MQNKKAAAHMLQAAAIQCRNLAATQCRKTSAEECTTRRKRHPKSGTKWVHMIFYLQLSRVMTQFFDLQLSRRIRLLKHLILKHARLFIFIFLVITWELGNMMVEKKFSIVSCYYGLVIKECNLIQFSSFFGSNFSSFLVVYFYLGSIDFKICQIFLKTLVM